MAGKAKIKNYLKYNRFELAEKLGIEIPKPKQKAPLIKIPFRRVRIIMTGKLSQPSFKIFYEKKQDTICVKLTPNTTFYDENDNEVNSSQTQFSN